VSSSEFSAELKPEERLRNLVLLSGAAATIAGFALIIHMPVNIVLRALLAVCWLGHGGFELFARAEAASRVTAIQVDSSGEFRVAGHRGHTEPVRLLAGSIVLGRLAWLRIRFEDGCKYAELLSGNAVKDPQWHRFQLIWRQTRQIVGRVDRS
jgi:hypothetical protein